MEYENYAKVHELRRILYKSKAWNLICSRRVAQDNQGKRTCGVNGVKSLTPAQRMELVGCKKEKRLIIYMKNIQNYFQKVKGYVFNGRYSIKQGYQCRRIKLNADGTVFTIAVFNAIYDSPN